MPSSTSSGSTGGTCVASPSRCGASCSRASCADRAPPITLSRAVEGKLDDAPRPRPRRGGSRGSSRSGEGRPTSRVAPATGSSCGSTSGRSARSSATSRWPAPATTSGRSCWRSWSRPAGRARLRGSRRHGLRRAHAPRSRRPPQRATRSGPLGRGRAEDQGRPLGDAGARVRVRVHRVDARRIDAPPALPGPARGQGAPRVPAGGPPARPRRRARVRDAAPARRSRSRARVRARPRPRVATARSSPTPTRSSFLATASPSARSGTTTRRSPP